MPSKMAMGRTICWLQHQRNLLLGLPTLEDTHEIGLQRAFPLAIVGGGPSLKDTLGELRAFPGPVMAAGSAHDYLLENGIQPAYCVILDPDPLMAAYLKRDGGACRYLVASHVAPHVLFALEGKAVYLFGAGGTFDLKEFDPLPVVMVGGRTVGTRAMGMALGLGYKRLHLFGMDSCLSADAVHAYEIPEDAGFDQAIRESARTVYCNGMTFRCASYMLGQATDFQRFMGVWGDQVSVEIHGDGLLAEIMKASQGATSDVRNAA
jgi:hypothetical protein